MVADKKFQCNVLTLPMAKLLVSVGFLAGVFAHDALFEFADNLTWKTRVLLISGSKNLNILPSALSMFNPILVGKLKNDLITRQLEGHMSPYRLNDTNNFFQEQDGKLFQRAIAKLLSVKDTSWLFSGANGSKMVVEYMRYVGFEVDHWLSNFKEAPGTIRSDEETRSNGILHEPKNATSLPNNYSRQLKAYSMEKIFGMEIDDEGLHSDAVAIRGQSAAESLLNDYFRHLKAFLKEILGKDIDDENVPIESIKALWRVDMLLPIAVGRAYYLLGRCYLEDKKFDVARKYFTIANELSNHQQTFIEQVEWGTDRSTSQPTPIETILSLRSGLLVCRLLQLESEVDTLVRLLAPTTTKTATTDDDVQRCMEGLKDVREKYAKLHDDGRVFYDIMSGSKVCLRTDHIHQAECTNQIVKTLLLELRLQVACDCLSGVEETMIKIMDLLSRSDDDFSLLNGVGRWRGIKRQRLYLLNLAEMLATISTTHLCAAKWPATATGVLFVKDTPSHLWRQPLLNQLLQESPENAAKQICEKIIDEQTAPGTRDRAKAEAEKLLLRLTRNGTDNTQTQ